MRITMLIVIRPIGRILAIICLHYTRMKYKVMGRDVSRVLNHISHDKFA